MGVLANLLLDDFDKEVGTPGRLFCRNADDYNIYVRPRAAGERVELAGQTCRKRCETSGLAATVTTAQLPLRYWPDAYSSSSGCRVCLGWVECKSASNSLKTVVQRGCRSMAVRFNAGKYNSPCFVARVVLCRALLGERKSKAALYPFQALRWRLLCFVSPLSSALPSFRTFQTMATTKSTNASRSMRSRSDSIIELLYRYSGSTGQPLREKKR
jgi:hypothetical protein